MAIELHFCKSDNTPWGFRLTGGADCDIPLTVVKVTEGSIAENAGLQVDDVLVRINDDSTAGLTHIEAHDVFLAAGTDVHIAVRRGDVVDIQDDEQSNEEVSNIMEGSLQETYLEAQQEKSIHMAERDSTQSTSKLHVTDEQIAEAISGETELLPDQNVLGVNFNKVDLTESTVLKVINEQTTETTKIDLQNKKWSTFLQKPKTPKVIPKKKEPEGPRASPYRVIIKKQTKNTAETINQEVEAVSKLLFEEINETDIQEPEEPSEGCEENVDESQTEEAELEQEYEQELTEESFGDTKIMEDEVSDHSEEQIGLEEKISERESSVTLEEQLAQVQQQLQALAQLPSAIQVSLDAVTQQLAKIVGATHKGEEETVVEQSVTSADERREHFTEGETLESGTSFEEVAGTSDEEHESTLEKSDDSDILEDDVVEKDQEYEKIKEDLDIDATSEQNHEECLTEEEQETERIEKEKQGRVNQWNALWPWSNATKPIYRINFLKYQPPPKNLDYLQHSEVFRLVHDMDPPRRGIAARPGKIILSEQDYYVEKPVEA